MVRRSQAAAPSAQVYTPGIHRRSSQRVHSHRGTALVACDGRVLLCHRSPGRRWYLDVWDLPGGHVEAAESPARAPVREVHEELGVSIAEPSGPELARFVTAAFDMRVWLVRACLDLHQPEPKIYGTGCRHRAARSTELARARCCTSLLYGACGAVAS
jgi:8-oxo-dGTP pyrophosphatase MutT (NUDIX family)